MASQPKRRLLILLTLAFVVVAGGFTAWQFGIRALKDQIEKGLGPRGEVREIRVGLTGVEILDLRIKAQPDGGWPSEDELRAQRIVVTPNLGDLLTAQLSINRIRIEGAYIAMLRTRKGQIKVLPGLLETKPETKPATTQKTEGSNGAGEISIRIDNIAIAGGVIELYDASIRKTPVKLRMEQIDASLGKLLLPDLTGQTAIKINGVLKGKQRDGKLAIDGAIELASKDSGFTTTLRGVDMTVLQPYLVQAAETGVRRGTLDLDIKSSVSKGKLRAPGTLTLSDLELSSGSGAFMGLPRTAAVGLMKNNSGKISMKFLLEGDINDPHFSLNEEMATRLTTSLASSLGISIESLAKGAGGIGSGTLKGIGDSLGKLLGQ